MSFSELPDHCLLDNYNDRFLLNIPPGMARIKYQDFLLVQELLPHTKIKAVAVIPSFLRRDLPLFLVAFECHGSCNTTAVAPPAASEPPDPLIDSLVQFAMNAFFARSANTPTYCSRHV